MKKNKKLKILSILGLSTAAISLSAITPTLISSCSSDSEANYRSKMFEATVQGLDAIVNAIFLNNYMKNAYNKNEIYNQIPKEVLRPKIFDLLPDPSLNKSIIEMNNRYDHSLFSFSEIDQILDRISRDYYGYLSDSESYCIYNHVINQKGWDKKTEITIEDFKRDFPNAVWIDGDAFKNCNFTKIQIPENIYILGGGLFKNMWNTLTEVEIPENNILYYGRNCFKNCNQLKNLPISQKAIFIDDGAFYGCKYDPIIKNLPNSIQYIGAAAFYNLENYDVKTDKPFPNNGHQEFNEFNFPTSLKIIDDGNFCYEYKWHEFEPDSKIFLNFSKTENDLRIGKNNFFIFLKSEYYEFDSSSNFPKPYKPNKEEFFKQSGIRKVIFEDNNASLFLNYICNNQTLFLHSNQNIFMQFPEFVLKKFEIVNGTIENNTISPANYSFNNPIFKKIIFSPSNHLITKLTSNPDPISYIKPIDFSKFKYAMFNNDIHSNLYSNLYFWLYYANRKDDQVFTFDLANFLEQIQTDAISQKASDFDLIKIIEKRKSIIFEIPLLNLLPLNGIEIVINKNKYFDAFIKNSNGPSCRIFRIRKKYNSDPEYTNYLRTKIKVKTIPEYRDYIIVPAEVQIIDIV